MDSKILIIRVGEIGSYTSTSLAMMEFEELTIIDTDIIEMRENFKYLDTFKNRHYPEKSFDYIDTFHAIRKLKLEIRFGIV